MHFRTEPLYPDGTYHVYNHAHGNEKLFRNSENYRFFLQKYQEYVSPIVDTFCYCLMPNHFHFLIRCKSEKHVGEHFLASRTNLSDFENLTGLAKQKMLSKHLSLQFSHMFNSYTHAFNKQYDRMGGLFMTPFNRIAIKEQKHLYALVKYIHLNPVEARICNDPANWQHSSYSSILNRNSSFICSSEVLAWYDDIENFKFIHTEDL